MVQAKKYTVARIFHGEIEDSDLELVEEELPSPQDDEYLVEAIYLSVDPYMRAYASRYQVGQVMIGGQVAKVIESKNTEFPVGSVVVGNLGWRSHTLIKPGLPYDVYILPDIGDLPLSLGLGALGMPGNTAYFGFLDICKPKAGETTVVSGAAGAVGNHVGQIAKIVGCKVVGIVGSEAKAQWLKSIGFDEVINYKTSPDLAQELKRVAPEGVDTYFDNVGGEISSIVINQMKPFGRVSVCGSISSYNDTSLPKATILQPALVFKQLEMRGFVVTQFQARRQEAIRQNLEWIQEGKLQFREHVTEGFENTLNALRGLFKGENIGKSVVRVKPNHVDALPLSFKNALSIFKQKENHKH